MSNQSPLLRLSLILARARRWERLSLFVVAFLFLAVLSTLLPIWSRASNSTSYLPIDLHARETADYSKYPLGTSFPAVGVGVIQAAMLDDNPFAPDIHMRVTTMAHELSLPVPTSTIELPTSTQSIFQVTESSTSVFALTASPIGTAGAPATNTSSSPFPFTQTPLPPPANTTPGSGFPTSTRTPTSSLPGISSPTSTRTSSPTPTGSTPGSANPTLTRTPTKTVTVTANSSATATQAGCAAYPSTGFVAKQDTWIDLNQPDSSNESNKKLQVEPGDKEKETLIQFDLSSIPVDSTVESAALYLTVTKTSSYTVDIFAIFDPWSENVSWTDQPFYDASTVVGSLTLSGNAPPNCVRAVSLDPALIEDWIDYPDDNYGIILVAVSGTGMTEYSSRESSTGPKLVVTYIP